MKIADAKKLFIQEWGVLTGNWGIRRTAGEVHALLLVSAKPLNADEIVEALAISTGNANMSIRSLLQWGVIQKVTQLGERKEHFQAEKDIWKLAQIIARERKRRELEPIQTAMSRFDKIEGPKPEVKDFQDLIQSIQLVSDIASKALDLLTRSGLTGFLRGLK